MGTYVLWLMCHWPDLYDHTGCVGKADNLLVGRVVLDSITKQGREMDIGR